MGQWVHENARKMHRAKVLVNISGKMEKATFGAGHDMVRRMDRQGEVLIWCRKMLGLVRDREWGPNLMNCCKPE